MIKHSLALLLILGLTLAFCFIAYQRKLGSSLNLEAKPFEILSCLLSAYLVYVAANLQTSFAARTTTDRAEKDILLRTLRECVERTNDVRDSFTVCITDKGWVHPGEIQTVTVKFRILNNSVDQLEAEIGISRFSSLSKRFPMVKELLRHYKASVTGLPPGEHKPAATSEANTKFRLLQLGLAELGFKINTAIAEEARPEQESKS